MRKSQIDVDLGLSPWVRQAEEPLWTDSRTERSQLVGAGCARLDAVGSLAETDANLKYYAAGTSRGKLALQERAIQPLM